MRPSILLTSALLLVGLGCETAVIGLGPETKGNGVVKQQTREVPEFTGVATFAIFETSVTIGPKASVVLDIEENLLPLVETNVKDGRLVVKFADNQTIRPTRPVKLTIVAPSIDLLRTEGVSKLVATLGETSRLKLEAAGASSLEVHEVVSEQLDVRIEGTARVQLQGQGKTLKIEGSGASRITADKAAFETAVVEMDGATQGEINVTTSIEGTISGASSLKVRKGAPCLLYLGCR